MAIKPGRIAAALVVRFPTASFKIWLASSSVRSLQRAASGIAGRSRLLQNVKDIQCTIDPADQFRRSGRGTIAIRGLCFIRVTTTENQSAICLHSQIQGRSRRCRWERMGIYQPRTRRSNASGVQRYLTDSSTAAGEFLV